MSPSIVIVLGVANLVGDGFSMAAANFLGTRAENQQLEKLRAIEHKHIRECPEGEREEVRQILAQQGFSGELLDQAVGQLTSDERTWVDTMLRHEYGVSIDRPAALAAASTTFASFMVIGAIPLIPFVLAWQGVLAAAPFLTSSVMTGIAFSWLSGRSSQGLSNSVGGLPEPRPWWWERWRPPWLTCAATCCRRSCDLARQRKALAQSPNTIRVSVL